MVGGFLFTGVLGFDYSQGLNLATIVVATVGAIVFLYVLDWFRRRDDRTRRTTEVVLGLSLGLASGGRGPSKHACTGAPRA